MHQGAAMPLSAHHSVPSEPPSRTRIRLVRVLAAALLRISAVGGLVAARRQSIRL